MINFSYFFIVILGLFPCGIFGLDETTVHEKGCVADRDPKDVNLNFNWMGSIKEFYAPFWSKLYAYRIASDLLEQKVSSFTQRDMDSPSCVVFKEGNVVTGRNQTRTFDITPDATSLTWKAKWNEAISAKFKFHLTDNKSYILGIACWEDGQSGWAVLSATATLTSEAKKDILDYLTNLGFKSEFAQEESYENCANIKSKKKNEGLGLLTFVPEFLLYLLF